MSGIAFTSLEWAVLRAICENYPDDLTALESQLLTASVRKRENTGKGFFTRISIERDPRIAVHARASAKDGPKARDMRNGPSARLDALRYGMGFILWLENGFADCLEGYCYGPDSTTWLDLAALDFEILGELPRSK